MDCVNNTGKRQPEKIGVERVAGEGTAPQRRGLVRPRVPVRTTRGDPTSGPAGARLPKVPELPKADPGRLAALRVLWSSANAGRGDARPRATGHRRGCYAADLPRVHANRHFAAVQVLSV